MSGAHRPAEKARAVLFDLDGTLIDSEPLCELAWRELLGQYGHAPTEEELREGRGRTFAGTREVYADKVALPPAEELYPAYWERLAELFRDRLEVFEDTAALLDALRAAYVEIGIVTNSQRHRVNLCLEVTGRDWAQVPNLAADEVAKPKPAPDLIEAMAGRLGIAPQACLVIEDTDSGERAARAAGAQVLRVDRIRASGADVAALAAELLA